MVQVQSTWFPLIDRNPQTYVDNIYKASAADYQATTQKVFHKSYIQLPVQFR
jgi:predicted acyl esterase